MKKRIDKKRTSRYKKVSKLMSKRCVSMNRDSTSREATKFNRAKLLYSKIMHFWPFGCNS